MQANSVTTSLSECTNVACSLGWSARHLVKARPPSPFLRPKTSTRFNRSHQDILQGYSLKQSFFFFLLIIRLSTPSYLLISSPTFFKNINKMTLSIYGLIEACVLLVNALAILNEERFLRPCKFSKQLLSFYYHHISLLVSHHLISYRILSHLVGWASPGPVNMMPMDMGGMGEDRPVKDKIITLLASVRTLLRSK